MTLPAEDLKPPISHRPVWFGWIPVGLLLLVLVAFYPSIHNGLVNWDDDDSGYAFGMVLDKWRDLFYKEPASQKNDPKS